MSAYSASVLATPGLLAYFQLGESSGSVAADSAGSHPGAYANCTLGVAGPTGVGMGSATAAGFNGSSSGVAVPTISIPGPIALECWAYATDRTANGVLVNKDPVNSSWMWFFFGSQVVFRGSDTTITNSVNAPPSAQWHHLAVTQSGTACKFYQDGALLASLTNSSTIANGTGGINIGQWASGGPGSVFNGRIAHVAIYSVEVPGATFLAHYNAATAPSVAPAASYLARKRRTG